MSTELTPDKASMSQRIAVLSPEKRQLLDKLLRTQGVDVARLAKIPRRKPSGTLPLSFAQQRLWFLDQLESGNPFYNISAAFYLNGQLNTPALEQSLNEITRRHESLRTVFHAIDGKPSQVILPESSSVLSVVDLRHLPATQQRAETERLIQAEALQAFDLGHGPLLRAGLYRLSEERHALLLVLHHIVSDAVSMAVLVREVVALYEAFSRGDDCPLPALPIQYADYAVWQRQWLEGQVLEEQLAYWREQLSGSPALLELPTDRPRPAEQSFAGASYELFIDKDLTAELQRLSRQEGVTLFMTLLAAFQTLLSRYSGQADILVGTPIAGRTRVECEPLIGFFINTLVMRAQLAPQMSFRELLEQVRQTSLGAYAYQDVPFEKLVEELAPVRSLSHTPLFQVMFALQNSAIDRLELSGLELEQLPLAGATAKFDLELSLSETDEGLSGLIEYDTELFDAAAIQRFSTHFLKLLKAIVARPDERLGRLPLLAEDERERQLVEWNQTQREYPRECGFDELFRAQVARTPEAVAVSCAGEQISYAELDEQVGLVARRLLAQGLGRDAVVALLGERSTAWLAGVLGVMRVGAAYLPLDPKQPAARLQQVLEESRVSVLLADEQLMTQAAEAAAGINGQTLRLLELNPAQAGEPASQVNAEPLTVSCSRGQELAYVIYTSGSTGRPKGAMIHQQGMLNHLFAKIEHLQLSSQDVVAQTASQCFDISVWQFLAALLVGARVEIIADEIAHDPKQLLETVVRASVTVLETVPSLLRLLIEEMEREGAQQVAGLRWLLATGEALPVAVCRQWLEVSRESVPVMNAYGPTECSDDVTHEVISSGAELSRAQVSIGRALANTQLYIVDAELQPTPVGVAGELLVGGDGLGRGYLHQPTLTAEKFIPHPFASQPGQRLYRTGDLARYLPDGKVEFIGRRDGQIKLRGFRIELGEIESVILAHPQVADAVVVAHEDGAGQNRLVAYVVCGDRQDITSAGLRSYIGERLPEYMIPSQVMLLTALPLTANGKVDRKALPAPEAFDSELAAGYVAPETEMEEKLCGIWSEVLGVERVGVEDNFFDLGGHSLLATQLMSRVLIAFNVQVGLRQFFEEPTVKGLALAIIQGQAAQTEDDEMAAILAELEGLAEEEAHAPLAESLSNTGD